MSETAVNPPHELNWFAMETKVRQLVQELIEPTIKRGMQDRLSIEHINGQLKSHKEKLDELGFAIYDSKDKDTVFENIDKRFENLEKEAKATQLKLKHKAAKAKERFTQSKAELAKLNDELTFIKKQNELITAELSQFRENMSSYRISLNNQIETHAKNEMKMYEELKFVLDEICNSKIIPTLTEQVAQHKNKLKEVELKLASSGQSMEQFAEKLAKLKNSKVEQKSYSAEITFLKAELNNLKNDLEATHNRTLTTENYLEKYLPLRIQNTISENFHNTFDPLVRKRFLEFEKVKYEKLNAVILKDDGKPNLNKCECYIPPLEKIEKAIILLNPDINQ